MVEIREPARDPVDWARQRAYRILLSSLARWERRRHRSEFARVERFCLFVGYPRSGHSIVGAMVDAHRHAVIAHELNVPPLIAAGVSRDDLYAGILARARWFHLRGNRANYDYRIPGGWQGRFEQLRVIGDKRGGFVSRWLLDHPEFLTQTRALVGVPLRLVHIVRNPFDNISSIATSDQRSLEESVEYYFRHCQSTARLTELCSPEELIELRHEEILSQPRAALVGLCEFLGLEPDPGYLDACCRVLFPKPTAPRKRLGWTAETIRAVERRVQSYPHLAGYQF